MTLEFNGMGRRLEKWSGSINCPRDCSHISDPSLYINGGKGK